MRLGRAPATETEPNQPVRRRAMPPAMQRIGWDRIGRVDICSKSGGSDLTWQMLVGLVCGGFAAPLYLSIRVAANSMRERELPFIFVKTSEPARACWLTAQSHHLASHSRLGRRRRRTYRWTTEPLTSSRRARRSKFKSKGVPMAGRSALLS